MKRQSNIPHRFASLAIPTPGKKADKGVKIETIDKWFSLYIRLKFSRPYSDEVDVRVADCFTCGKTQLITVLQNGHCIGRQHFATRWDERNCRPQCVSCNLFNEGEHGKFREGLVAIYGETEVAEMESLKRTRKKPTKSESFELSEKFRKAYKELLST